MPIKHLRKIFLVLLILAVFLGGCQSQTGDTRIEQPEQREQPNQNDKPQAFNYVVATQKDPRGEGKWTELKAFELDFNNDNNEDNIALYTAAERDDKGQLMWDDGQKWLLAIQSGENYYPLLDEYVQLGSVYFSVFTEMDSEQPKVLVLASTGAGIIAREYIFVEEKNGFREEVVYKNEGINLLGTSLPAYQ